MTLAYIILDIFWFSTVTLAADTHPRPQPPPLPPGGDTRPALSLPSDEKIDTTLHISAASFVSFGLVCAQQMTAFVLRRAA